MTGLKVKLRATDTERGESIEQKLERATVKMDFVNSNDLYDAVLTKREIDVAHVNMKASRVYSFMDLSIELTAHQDTPRASS